jgi:hypothetical protein
MKKIFYFLPVICIIISTGSCKKGNVPSSQPPGNQAQDNLVYRSSCSISEIYWLADNETVFLNDFCNGTLKKINTTTKAVQLFDIVARGHLVQRILYTDQLPDYVYYLALAKDATGAYSMPIKLFSLNLTNGISRLIKDGITQLPTWGGYTLGRKKLSIKSGTELLVIDLEQATSQIIPVSENVQAFSPDDTKMLIYSSSQTPLITTVFDFGCQCVQPKTLAGAGIPFWRTQAIYGYNINSGVLNYLNLESGAVLKSFPDFAQGPWVAPNSGIAIFLIKGANYSTDQKGVLMSFDFVTGQTKEIIAAPYNPFSSFINGIYLAAVSPNQKKVAYVQNGGDLRVSILQP